MADLNLKVGDTVLLAFTVVNPQPDNEGEVKLHDLRGELYYWIKPEEIYSKVYVKPKEPVELGSRVADNAGNTYTRFTNRGAAPWVSESGVFCMWDEIHEPELVK